MGDSATLHTFLQRLWPDARAIADPDAHLYDLFSVGRAELGQLFSPAVWAAGVRAALKGSMQGRPVGDVARMPGFFLFHGARLVKLYEPKHAGDHPNLRRFADRPPGA